MKKHLKKLYYVLPVIIIFIWFIFYRVEINKNEFRIYKFLITNKNQSIEAAWVLFYFYPKNYFYLLEIDNQTKVKNKSGNLYQSIFSSEEILKEHLKTLYGIEGFYEEISFNEEEKLNLLKSFGGTTYFNRFSTYFPIGEVYINDINYNSYIEKIENIHRRKDEVLGIWMNLLVGNFENFSSPTMISILIESLYEHLNLKINYVTFYTLLKPLFDKFKTVKISDKLYLSFDKINLEELKINNNEEVILIPYKSGKYDKDKIFQKLNNIKNVNWEKEVFPILVQIKNHTKENRLAAKTAGYLRLSRFSVVEYIGSTKFLDRSVVLDYTFQPVKRRYISKISKVNKFYYMFDYRENYDFSLYLGGDFFGITNK